MDLKCLQGIVVEDPSYMTKNPDQLHYEITADLVTAGLQAGHTEPSDNCALCNSGGPHKTLVMATAGIVALAHKFGVYEFPAITSDELTTEYKSGREALKSLVAYWIKTDPRPESIGLVVPKLNDVCLLLTGYTLSALLDSVSEA